MVDPIVQELTNALLAVVTVISAVLTLLGALSYRRTGNPKLAWVSGAFGLFLAKSMLLVVALYVPALLTMQVELAPVLLDLVILLVLYIGIVRA